MRDTAYLPCQSLRPDVSSLRPPNSLSNSLSRVPRRAHRYLGVGTQRVAEEAQKLLPKARVLRWDHDVTSKQKARGDIARSFAQHDADVLVGTQMIAKGLDFPLVTLVGVIVADVGLHLPDFRAAERTFQLTTQVAGRAGRAELPSRVIVQRIALITTLSAPLAIMITGTSTGRK